MSEAAKKRHSYAMGYLIALFGIQIPLPTKSEPGASLLLSSDGYTLQDVNGQNLIPKES